MEKNVFFNGTTNKQATKCEVPVSLMPRSLLHFTNTTKMTSVKVLESTNGHRL